MSEKVKKKHKISPIIIVVIVIAVLGIGYFFLRFRIHSLIVRMTSDSVAVAPIENENTSNILIAYFTLGENSGEDAITSASVTVVDKVAKGNVRAIADMIQERTKGDLFSVQTAERYAESYNDVVGVAKSEQDNDERPALSNHIKDFDSYDVIFVGFPTWWSDMPMAMYTFFDEYDFSGKTIVPFNAAMGSEFGVSIESIKKLEPDATVIEDGYSVYNDKAENSKDEVSEWLTKLGY